MIRTKLHENRGAQVGMNYKILGICRYYSCPWQQSRGHGKTRQYLIRQAKKIGLQINEDKTKYPIAENSTRAM